MFQIQIHKKIIYLNVYRKKNGKININFYCEQLLSVLGNFSLKQVQ